MWADRGVIFYEQVTQAIINGELFNYFVVEFLALNVEVRTLGATGSRNAKNCYDENDPHKGSGDI